MLAPLSASCSVTTSPKPIFKIKYQVQSMVSRLNICKFLPEVPPVTITNLLSSFNEHLQVGPPQRFLENQENVSIT